MANGPWNFSGLAQAHMYCAKQFGIVPVPTRVAGQRVIVPLAGEDWTDGPPGPLLSPGRQGRAVRRRRALPFSRNARRGHPDGARRRSCMGWAYLGRRCPGPAGII